MIIVDNLTKRFGTVTAVDNVSFQIEPGSVIGLLGPNGAGKSTTMRLLTGYLAPDSGAITVDGKSIDTNTREIQRRIGYLPENNPLYTDMLVSEALTFAANLSGLTTKQHADAFDFAVSSVGIQDYFYRPINELSKGYKQRVGLAMALLHKPDILILDEPSEGLDPTQRSEIRSLIKTLSKDRTILLSTHVMQEVAAVCDRILIINKGKLVADGSPSELTAQAAGKRKILLKIEGNGITESLDKLDGVLDIRVIDTTGTIVSIELTIAQDATIQPHLAQLVREHNWIIWELHEHVQNLEDVFQKLTINTSL